MPALRPSRSVRSGVLLVALAVAACGGSGDDGNPAVAVQDRKAFTPTSGAALTAERTCELVGELRADYRLDDVEQATELRGLARRTGDADLAAVIVAVADGLDAGEGDAAYGRVSSVCG